MQKANAVTQSAAQEAAQSAEQSAKEKLMSILEQQKVGAQREKEALHMQVPTNKQTPLIMAPSAPENCSVK